MKHLFFIFSILFSIQLKAQNKVGIGTNTPTEKLDVIGNIKADTLKVNAIKLLPNAGSGKVLISDANGNGTWQTISSGGGGNLNNAYNYLGLGLGRTIDALNGAVEINGTDGLRVSGNLGFGNNISPLTGKTDFFFYPRKGALRAGIMSPAYYSNDSIGEYSIAMGENNKVTGNNAVAIGKFNLVKGINSMALGNNNSIVNGNGFALGNNDTSTGFNNINIGFGNKTNGNNNLTLGSVATATGSYALASGYGSYTNASDAIALGYYDTAIGEGSFAAGYINKAQGIYSNVFGQNNIANGYAGTVIGMYNDTLLGAQNSISNSTPLFTVGNGTNTTDRKNAMLVRKDGNVGIGTSQPKARLHVVDSNVIFSADSTIPTTPSPLGISGAGRRMFWYADKAAFRAGEITSDEWDDINIGPYSFATGIDNKAKGVASSSMGYGNNSSGNFSSTIGALNNNKGFLSILLGVSNFADTSDSYGIGNTNYLYAPNTFGIGEYNWLNFDSKNSMAIGHSNNITDSNSLALGDSNSLYGATSRAFGNSNDAFAANSLVIGDSNILHGTHSNYIFGRRCRTGLYEDFAIGDSCVALGISSFAMGTKSIVTGQNAFGIGFRAKANAFSAFSIGNQTTASGTNSFATGFLSQAIGDYSFSMGQLSKARSYVSLAIGQFNDTIAGSNPTAFVTSDPIFYVGNGTSPSSRSNAMVVFKNGNTDISGYTQLGKTSEGAPAIKMKKLTVNSSTIQGGFTSVAHGLTSSKIIAYTTLLTVTTSGITYKVLPNHIQTGYQYTAIEDGTNITIGTVSGNSASILNKPVTIVITYEE